MGFFDKLFGRSSSVEVRRITLKNPLVVRSPKIGFLNLMGEEAQPIIEDDRAALSHLFSSEVSGEAQPPVCDVLMIYARVRSDGMIEGTSSGLREIVRDASAPIVIVAMENAPNAYIAASRRTGFGQANLVLTIERKGKVFGSFFAELFRMMKSGVTMPVAWVKLAPQIPGHQHDNCPSAIFAAEISHIIFQ